jgi:hypothetical protein
MDNRRRQLQLLVALAADHCLATLLVALNCVEAEFIEQLDCGPNSFLSMAASAPISSPNSSKSGSLSE